MSTILNNCRIISPGLDIASGSIEIDNGIIMNVSASPLSTTGNASVHDLRGLTVMPGFIDVHCHGRSGFDATDSDPRAISVIAVDKLSEGVTTLLPTTLTLPEEQLADTLRNVSGYQKNRTGAKIPGVHLEGPYLNCNCLGAQNPDYVRTPDINEVKRLDAIVKVLKVSFAVELGHGLEFTSELLDAGIVPSCGHSAAKHHEFEQAHRHGLTNLTHFCNQMTPLHHRDIGLVGAGLFHDDVYTELICDKIHLCPDMIRLIFKIKDISRILLITDAMRAAGLPDGKSQLGGLEVIVKNGEARLASNGALAGSTLKLNQALKNVFEETAIPLPELVRTSSLNQAESLNLPQLGIIETGYFADLAVLDHDFNVSHTFVNGELKYSAT